MRAVREALANLGYAMERYHQESFHAPAPEAELVPADVVPDGHADAVVAFAASGVSVTCLQTDTILRAARSAGLVIPTGCTMGLCGTCKIRKTAGRVHMVHNGGITEEDIADDYVLACCSRPIGHVTVDF